MGSYWEEVEIRLEVDKDIFTPFFVGFYAKFLFVHRPRLEDMIVTTSKDNSVRVWRSKENIDKFTSNKKSEVNNDKV